MHVFGLTGGIGTGKSTVARWWSERGLGLVDADELARDVVAPGAPGLAQLVSDFGPEILAPDGTLDRKAMAQRVFTDETARLRLEAVTHPLVRDLARQRFASLENLGHVLACYEVPLLFEVGLQAELRPVVVVAADAATQLARILKRDGGTRENAEARVAAQWPLERKVAQADYVIDNDGSSDATIMQADSVLSAICSSLGIAKTLFGL